MESVGIILIVFGLAAMGIAKLGLFYLDLPKRRKDQ